jgi:hypothetical protein
VPLDELSDDHLTLALSVAQYATDLALVEAERRGLVTQDDAVPFIPFVLPEGVEFIPTILTRPPRLVLSSPPQPC